MLTQLAGKYAGQNPNDWIQEFERLSTAHPGFAQDMQGVDSPEKLEAKIKEWKQKGLWKSAAGPVDAAAPGDSTQPPAPADSNAPTQAGPDLSYGDKEVSDAIYYADQPTGGDPEVKAILQQVRSQGQAAGKDKATIDKEAHEAVAAHLAKGARRDMSTSTHGSDYDADSQRSGIADENYRPRSRKKGRQKSEDELFFESLNRQMGMKPRSWLM